MEKIEQLFNKLKTKGIFWSYNHELTYTALGKESLIEYTLKYGDFDDIKQLFKLFNQDTIYEVWEQRLKSDKRFIRLNVMLARVFFGMDVESSYFKSVENERSKKLRLLAAQN